MSITVLKMTEVLDSLQMDIISDQSGSGDQATDFGDTGSGDGFDSIDIVFDLDVSMSEIIAVDYFDFNSKTNGGGLSDSGNIKWTAKHTIGTCIGAFALVVILIINAYLMYKCCTKKNYQKKESTPRLSKFMHSPKKSFRIRPLPMVVRKTEIWPKCEFYGLDINNFADAVGAIHPPNENGAFEKSLDSFSSGSDTIIPNDSFSSGNDTMIPNDSGMFNRAFDNLPAVDQVYTQNEHLI